VAKQPTKKRALKRIDPAMVQPSTQTALAIQAHLRLVIRSTATRCSSSSWLLCVWFVEQGIEDGCAGGIGGEMRLHTPGQVN
jgi:hypothetical protein